MSKPKQDDEKTAGTSEGGISDEARRAQEEIVQENESFSVPQEDTNLETESRTERNR